jgi:hypothetical protein
MTRKTIKDGRIPQGEDEGRKNDKEGQRRWGKWKEGIHAGVLSGGA